MVEGMRTSTTRVHDPLSRLSLEIDSDRIQEEVGSSECEASQGDDVTRGRTESRYRERHRRVTDLWRKIRSGPVKDE